MASTSPPVTPAKMAAEDTALGEQHRGGSGIEDLAAGMNDLKTDDADARDADDKNEGLESGDTKESENSDGKAADLRTTDAITQHAGTQTDETKDVDTKDAGNAEPVTHDTDTKDEPAKETREERRERLRKKYDSIVLYFKTTYPETNLETWQAVCRDVGVEEGESMTACKRNLKKVRYNIYDFVEARERGEQPRQFPTARTLAEYSINSHKVFPLRRAKEHPVLRWMLIYVLYPKL